MDGSLDDTAPVRIAPPDRWALDVPLDTPAEEGCALWRALWCVAKLYGFMLLAAVLFALLLKWAL